MEALMNESSWPHFVENYQLCLTVSFFSCTQLGCEKNLI